jgi:hypothetical protein
MNLSHQSIFLSLSLSLSFSLSFYIYLSHSLSLSLSISLSLSHSLSLSLSVYVFVCMAFFFLPFSYTLSLLSIYSLFSVTHILYFYICLYACQSLSLSRFPSPSSLSHTFNILFFDFHIPLRICLLHFPHKHTL